jgi:hypothetical protein
MNNRNCPPTPLEGCKKAEKSQLLETIIVGENGRRANQIMIAKKLVGKIVL